MKRFFVTILSILYLASAMGATVDVHYCMGKSVGANFVHKDDDKCRKCGMHKSNTKGCCQDKQETFKTSDHQLTNPSVEIAYHALAALPATTAYYSSPSVAVYACKATKTVLINAPPNTWRTKPIYLSIRNFRI
jgi:hypothetical protein